jgi:hypothetical protein
MRQLEQPLDDAFKKLPQLPEESRRGLVAALPWLALVGAVFACFSAAHQYNVATTVNDAFSVFGYVSTAVGYVIINWIGLLLLLAEAVLFLVAFPTLRVYKESGWRLLFWAMLISIFYGVIMNVFNGTIDLAQLIVSLLGAAIGLYFLFQVRPYFSVAVKAKSPTEKTDTEV